MRILLGFIFLSFTLFAKSVLVYDRDNIYLDNLLNTNLESIQTLSLKPTINEQKALYMMGQNQNVVFAVTTQTILNGIYNNMPEKLSKYTFITSLRSAHVHIVVSKTSPYKTIYDLDGRSISLGKENNAMDLFALSLSSNFNINFNKYYGDTQIALSNMLQGNGLDAVVFSDTFPSKLLENYKEHIRLISIPNMKNFQKANLSKEEYAQEIEIRTVNSNLVLIAKTSFIEHEPEGINQILTALYKSEDIKSNCKSSLPIMQSLPYQKHLCQTLQNSVMSKSASKKEEKQVMALNLVKKIKNLEDIEIYMNSLVKNKSFGGLSKQTEIKKIDKLISFYNDEKSFGNAPKVIIKSYANNASAYQGGKQIFRLLQKKGISRSDMIIKSFNTKKVCPKEEFESCQYLEHKVLFEFL